MNHYDDVGTGFPIILIHGQPFDRTMWRPQVRELSRTYRTVAPDLRGYGTNPHESRKTVLSEFAEDIWNLAESLGVKRCILAGLSMGGQIAMECYRQRPDKISGLVFADTFAQLDSAERKQMRLLTADRLEREGMEQYAVEELPRMIAPHHIQGQPDVAHHVLSMMRSAPPAGAAAALRGRAERIDYTPLLSDIRAPTLIVVGDQDQYTPVSDAQFMHGRVRGSRLVIIHDAGHLPNLEQPQAFTREVRRFIDDVLKEELRTS